MIDFSFIQYNTEHAVRLQKLIKKVVDTKKMLW